jgi:hypothetical protein
LQLKKWLSQRFGPYYKTFYDRNLFRTVVS